MDITSLPLIGEFEVISVYEYFDMPLLFSIRNMVDNFYVVSFAKKSAEEETWMATQVTEHRLYEFESGLVSLRRIFEAPQTNYNLLISIPSSEDPPSVNYLSGQSEQLVPFLAEEDEHINVRSISLDEADAIARRNMTGRRAFVNIELNKNSGSRSSINLKLLGNIFANFQDALSNVGMNVSGMDNERGRIPNAIFEETAVDFAAGWNGSIGITLLSPENDRLLSTNTLERSLSILLDMLESDSTLGYFFRYSNERAQGLSRRTLLKFKSFLASVKAAECDFIVSTESITGFSRRISIPYASIRSKIDQIEHYADTSERVYPLRGELVAVNAATSRLEIIESDTGVKYIGYMVDDKHFQSHSVDVPSKQIFLISEITSVNGNTGEEVSSYRVINYYPDPDN